MYEMNDIIPLTSDSEEQLSSLVNHIEDTISNPDYWTPISDKVRDNFFVPEFMQFYGLFDSGELVGAAALAFDESEWGPPASHLTSRTGRVAKITRLMVREDFRNKGIGTLLLKKLVSVGHGMGFDTLVTIVHPDNETSISIMKSAGLTKAAEYTTDSGHFRFVFRAC